MSCANDVIDYLYFERNCDDEEIIDVALAIINDCLRHMEENESESKIESMNVKIHNEILSIVGDGGLVL